MMFAQSLRTARTILVRQRRRGWLSVVISSPHAHAPAPAAASASSGSVVIVNHYIGPSAGTSPSARFFHASLPRQKEEEAKEQQTDDSNSDAANEDAEPVQYSTPELTSDAALHKAGLTDPDRPDWQNPLVHATGKTANGGDLSKTFREDFDSEEEFQAAVLPAPPLATTPAEEEIPPAPEYLEALADEIVNLTVLEMNELRNKMGQHYGFHEGMLSPDDDDLVGDDGGDGDGEDSAAAAVEEKTAFDLKLTGFDAKAKIKVIKEVRSIAGLGLKEAKELVEGAPTTILKDLKQDQAEEVKGKLEELGATVEIV